MDILEWYEKNNFLINTQWLVKYNQVSTIGLYWFYKPESDWRLPIVYLLSRHRNNEENFQSKWTIGVQWSGSGKAA